MFSTVLAEQRRHREPGLRLDRAGSASRHLLAKASPGGSPARRNAASANAAIVSGMRRPIPSISLTRSTPAATYSAPAQKNSVIFRRPWLAMCSTPPAKASGTPRATPRTM